tara:strand:+ start:1347 stop:1538 length:192 start_codon:yes stop_codon:yes gene_type:complete
LELKKLKRLITTKLGQLLQLCCLNFGIKTKFIIEFNPDYVIGFPVFTGSVAIARQSDCLEILA